MYFTPPLRSLMSVLVACTMNDPTLPANTVADCVANPD